LCAAKEHFLGNTNNIQCLRKKNLKLVSVCFMHFIFIKKRVVMIYKQILFVSLLCFFQFSTNAMAECNGGHCGDGCNCPQGYCQNGGCQNGDCQAGGGCPGGQCGPSAPRRIAPRAAQKSCKPTRNGTWQIIDAITKNRVGKPFRKLSNCKAAIKNQKQKQGVPPSPGAVPPPGVAPMPGDITPMPAPNFGTNFSGTLQYVSVEGTEETTGGKWASIKINNGETVPLAAANSEIFGEIMRLVQQNAQVEITGRIETAPQSPTGNQLVVQGIQSR
jgi:hypothetical protein